MRSAVFFKTLFPSARTAGLGKTAQAICYLAVLAQPPLNQTGPHMVVAPASLLENWERELEMWCPGLRVIPYYGKSRAYVREQMDKYRKRVEEAKA